jgi:hypothetical protein
MDNFLQGSIAGIVFGVITVLLMSRMTFPDKRAALLGAFFSRFAIGFLIGVVVLPVPGWIQGALVGLLVSLPEAIITKSYIPILTIGVIGGAIIGLVIA